MRKHYDFAKAQPNRYVGRLPGQAGRTLPPPGKDDPDPLSPAHIVRVRRQLVDLDDRTRYLLVSTIGPRFVLYYQVTSDTYIMNEPALATLFKRRQAALAIKRLLTKRVRILECMVDRKGRLIKSSIGRRRQGRARNKPGAA